MPGQWKKANYNPRTQARWFSEIHPVKRIYNPGGRCLILDTKLKDAKKPTETASTIVQYAAAPCVLMIMIVIGHRGKYLALACGCDVWVGE
jgi:hypothetical protein